MVNSLLQTHPVLGANTLFGLWTSFRAERGLSFAEASHVLQISQACGEIHAQTPPTPDLRDSGVQPTSRPLQASRIFEKVVPLVGSETLEAFRNFQTGEEPSLHAVSSRRIRQETRDLIEAEGYRRLQLHIPGNVLSLESPLVSAMRAIDRNEGDLYAALRALPLAEGDSHEGLLETVHEILNRHRPMAWLNPGTEAYRLVQEFMRRTVEISHATFPEDWERFKAEQSRNFISGEGTPHEISGEYRFARLLLNARAGKPLFGPPAGRERQALLAFARAGLGVPAENFVSALMAIRDHLDRFTPEARRALEEADPWTRFQVVDSYFGCFRHRNVADPEAALALTRFIGDIGFYREIAVSTHVENGRLETTLSLGDIAGVDLEDDNDTVLLHTHPWTEPLFDPVTSEFSVEDDRFLFSQPDIVAACETAKRLFQTSQASEPFPTASFDPATRIHRQWLQSHQGAARMEVELTPEGRVKGIRMDYGLRPGHEAVAEDRYFRDRIRANEGAYAQHYNGFQYIQEDYQRIVEKVFRA